MSSLWKVPNHSFPICVAYISVFLMEKPAGVVFGTYQERAREAPALGVTLQVDVPKEDKYAPVPSPQPWLRLPWVLGRAGGRGNRDGVDGEQEERRPCKAAGKGDRKGEHGCRELLVASEAGGQAGGQFPCDQELPAGKPHTTQGREEQRHAFPQLGFLCNAEHPE